MYLNLAVPATREADTWRELVSQCSSPKRGSGITGTSDAPGAAQFADGQRLIDVLFNFHDFHQVDTDLID